MHFLQGCNHFNRKLVLRGVAVQSCETVCLPLIVITLLTFAFLFLLLPEKMIIHKAIVHPKTLVLLLFIHLRTDVFLYSVEHKRSINIQAEFSAPLF